MLRRRTRARSGAAAVAALCAALAGCGSSGPKLPAATQVCRGNLEAARKVVSSASMQITNSDPNNIGCVLNAGGLHVKVSAQAMSHAWNQFNTLSAHFAQAFGPGTVHDAANTPIDLALPYAAFWIPGQNTLYATNGTESEGGSYVTVNVTGHGSQASRVNLAEKVAAATLAVAPRGPSPGASAS